MIMKKVLLLSLALSLSSLFLFSSGGDELKGDENLMRVYEVMSDNVFESICLRLGDNVDAIEVARYYVDHLEEFGTMNYNEVK